MKAVVYDKKNSENSLALREIEKPIPDDNEVLVQIHAVSAAGGGHALGKVIIEVESDQRVYLGAENE